MQYVIGLAICYEALRVLGPCNRRSDIPIYRFQKTNIELYHKIVPDIQYTNFKNTIYWRNILIYSFHGVEYNIQISND